MEKKKEQLLLIEPQNELKFRGPFNTHVTSRMRLTNPTDKVILYKIKTTAPKKYCVRPNGGILSPQKSTEVNSPFNTHVTSRMRLTNPTDKVILYKIKTTAPKKYCVRPNGGILSPQKSTEVNIVLQPFIFDPNEKNRHKFMVQSAIAPAGAEQYASVEQLWKEINPLELMDSKFAVLCFEVDGGQCSVKLVAMITTSDTAKATAELRQLREEESQLRQENLMLKEQVLRLKMALDDAGANDGAKGGWSGNTPSYQQQIAYAPPNLPLPVYLIISLLVGILCMLFGKFVL
uniref:MSP domain-containing protein n=1 Tax=Lutzomyia longipalpis TaxID=7200 RepID=A0A1B0CEA1_LUTLO